MSIFPVGFGSRKASGIPPINNSLRFRSAASAFLNRTPSITGDASVWTWSGWVKRGTLGTLQDIFSAAASATAGTSIRFDASDKLQVYRYNGTAFNYNLITNQVFRDPSAWYHIVVAEDTNQSIASDRLKVYVNGVQITSFATASYPPASYAEVNGAGYVHRIGRSFAASGFLDGYQSRICWVDGQALTPSSFGYTDPATGQWVSKSATDCKTVVDAGGTNSFMLDFDTVATLGNDYSAKNNDWTPNNISTVAGVTYDWMIDTPTNNFAVLNPLDGGSAKPINANLTAAIVTNALSTRASFKFPTSGKWYFETNLGGSAAFIVGLATSTTTITANPYNAPTYNGLYCGTANTFYLIKNGVLGAGISVPFSNSTVIGIAVDSDNNRAWLSVNNVWYDASNGTTGNPSGGTNPVWTSLSTDLFPFVGCNTNNAHANFGQRPFAYTPPTGFKALCTANLTSDDVIESGSFTGNANANGIFVWCNGTPETLTINGNAVTWGTHADKLANGFKLRTANSSYNSTGTNNWTATILSPEKKSAFRNQRAKGNP